MNRIASAAFRILLHILSSTAWPSVNSTPPSTQSNNTRSCGRHQGFGGEWSEVGGERSRRGAGSAQMCCVIWREQLGRSFKPIVTTGETALQTDPHLPGLASQASSRQAKNRLQSVSNPSSGRMASRPFRGILELPRNRSKKVIGKRRASKVCVSAAFRLPAMAVSHGFLPMPGI